MLRSAVVAYYAAFLDLAGRRCVVVGGGEVAERKVESLVRAGARVTVIAPALTPGLARAASSGGVEHVAREYRCGDLESAVVVIAATDDPAIQRTVADEGARRNVLVNVVDVPELSSFIVPAVLERGDLHVAVSTSGAAPALAARVRDLIAADIGPEYGDVARLLCRIRERLRREGRSFAERRRILRELAGSDLAVRIGRGDRAGAARIVAAALGEESASEVFGV